MKISQEHPLLPTNRTPSKSSISDGTKGMLWMLVSAVTMGLMNVVAKVLRDKTKITAL